jgi:hypothetical protein
METLVYIYFFVIQGDKNVVYYTDIIDGYYYFDYDNLIDVSRQTSDTFTLTTN